MHVGAKTGKTLELPTSFSSNLEEICEERQRDVFGSERKDSTVLFVFACFGYDVM
jgi:hypothetical protein